MVLWWCGRGEDIISSGGNACLVEKDLLNQGYVVDDGENDDSKRDGQR